MKFEWGSQDVAGNFVSFEKEKRQKAAKAPGSKGPRSRGGKRNPKAPEGAAKMAPASAVSRGGGFKPKPAQAKPSAKRAKGAGSAPIQRAKPEMAVQDVKQTIAPMGKMPAKRDVRIGGLLGRTGGKWHLGKRPGKG